MSTTKTPAKAADKTASTKATTTSQKTAGTKFTPEQTAKNQKGKLHKSDVDVVNDGANSTSPDVKKDPAVQMVKPMKQDSKKP